MHDRSVLDVEVVSELQDIMGQDFQMLVESFQRDGERRHVGQLDEAELQIGLFDRSVEIGSSHRAAR